MEPKLISEKSIDNLDDVDEILTEDDEDVELSKYEKPDVMISSFNSKIVPLDVESASNNVIDYESKNCE
jgi:hypothetical protein